LEADGAVFLPAAGKRNGTKMEATLQGVYWSAKQYGGSMAANYVLIIMPNSIISTNYDTSTNYEWWYMGCSVRLVRDF